MLQNLGFLSRLGQLTDCIGGKTLQETDAGFCIDWDAHLPRSAKGSRNHLQTLRGNAARGGGPAAGISSLHCPSPLPCTEWGSARWGMDLSSTAGLCHHTQELGPGNSSQLLPFSL